MSKDYTYLEKKSKNYIKNLHTFNKKLHKNRLIIYTQNIASVSVKDEFNFYI